MTDTHGLNLTTHRATESVWERSGWDGTREQLAMTRWLLGIGGGALALQGLRQRSLTGSLLAGIGGSLAWWALTGEGDLPDARRWLGHRIERASGTGGGLGREGYFGCCKKSVVAIGHQDSTGMPAGALN